MYKQSLILIFPFTYFPTDLVPPPFHFYKSLKRKPTLSLIIVMKKYPHLSEEAEMP
jgi:hypothetical protein